MKILLVTDTHGQLTCLNDLAREHSADAIIHAGDFGFYEDASIDRLSGRELKLRIVHSALSDSEKKRILGRNPDDQKRFVRERLPLSDLPRFLAGEMCFETPVYVVWGNHEDVEVVKRFHSGEYKVDGLHLLHDESTFHLEDFHIFGLGGNFIAGKKLFQNPIAGGSGKVWSVLSQYLRLLETVRSNAREGEKRIFVSHVSSGKEAFITLLGIHLDTDLVVSGHMDPPFSMTWNDFAIRTPEEGMARVEERLSSLAQIWEALDPRKKEKYVEAIHHLSNLPTETVPYGRGQRVPKWYLNMFNVNLADIATGYALLETYGDKWKIESRARGPINLSQAENVPGHN